MEAATPPLPRLTVGRLPALLPALIEACTAAPDDPVNTLCCGSGKQAAAVLESLVRLPDTGTQAALDAARGLIHHYLRQPLAEALKDAAALSAPAAWAFAADVFAAMQARLAGGNAWFPSLLPAALSPTGGTYPVDPKAFAWSLPGAWARGLADAAAPLGSLPPALHGRFAALTLLEQHTGRTTFACRELALPRAYDPDLLSGLEKTARRLAQETTPAV